MRIAIVGAGIAGLACAEGLTGHGHELLLFDKGRAPGGRMAARGVMTALGEAQFDMGAQYFTVRGAAFRQRVDRWVTSGLVAPWPSAGAEAYVGVPAMNAPLRQMADTQTVEWSTRITRVASTASGWQIGTADTSTEVDCTLLALPAEQAGSLLATIAPDLYAKAMATPSEPCWSAMLAFAAPLPVNGNCYKSRDVIDWASRNCSKPGRSGPETWVAHATVQWSKQHLEADPASITHALKAALAALLDTSLPPLVYESGHRWRYARCGAEGSGALWDTERRLGVCGDWLIAPRVEAAWTSGTLLAERILESQTLQTSESR